MATAHDFEARRRERRRRERLRKKRIRALILLILFIGVIVLICVLISTCSKKDDIITDTETNSIEQTEQTEPPVNELTPTNAPAISSLSAPNIPPASQQNDLLQIIRNSGESKYCYLTFDDGPTDNITPQILDTLRRYNVKATFFQIGSLIKANPDMARRVYEEGHLLANHSDGHNYAKLYVSTETFMNEVNQCYENIKEVTGETEPFKLVRFPGGSFKSSADIYSDVKQECKESLKQYGFYQCDWNALNGDAEGRTKDAQELLEYMIENLDDEDNVVVLMHDAAAKQATADALPSIIEYFINEGYTFHRLDDIDYHGSTAATSSPSYSDDEDSSYSDEDEDYDEDYDDEDEDSSSSSKSSSKSSSSKSASPTEIPMAATPQPTASSSSSSGGSGVIIIQ